MQHPEKKEQSGEFLRIAVRHMGEQDAGYYPASYALWYEFASGRNPELTQVLQGRLNAKIPLTDTDVSEFHAKYLVKRDVANIERLQQRLLDVLHEASQCIYETGKYAVRLNETIEGHTARLRQPITLELIRTIVDELLAETQTMCSSSIDQSSQLEAVALEVRQLGVRLQESEAKAVKDSLTGLLNRGALEDRAKTLAQQPGGLAGCSMILIDVDWFKHINDTYGHLAGDAILRATAEMIRARSKGSDICGRLGGDEFALLLPRTPLVGAKALAEQIRTTVLEGTLRRLDRTGEAPQITLSLGVAEGSLADSFDTLLRRADAALYLAKHGGRNRVVAESRNDSDIEGSGSTRV